MVQNYTHFLPEPEVVSDLTDWGFRKTRKCPSFDLQEDDAHTRTFGLACDLETPEVVYTSGTHEVFTVNQNDTCLAEFIEQRCYDDQAVPNVVHYVWFGDQQLGYFSFLSLISVLR